MRPRPLYDIVALLARAGVGTVFIAHGWQKVQVGITSTSDQFTAWDVPFPTPAAVYATFVELLGGAALVLGLALPVAGVLLFIDMAGAAVFVNGSNGIFLVDEHGTVAKNGFELALVLGLAGLVFAVGGAGRLTLDGLLFGRRKAAGAAATAKATGAAGPTSPDATAGARHERRALRSRAESPSITESLPSAPTEPDKPITSAASGKSDKPDKPAKPAMPATTGGPTVAESAASPRLAADIVRDTSGDTLVAGRKKRRSGGKGGKGATDPSDQTQPIPGRRGAAKSDPDD